jgi:glycosyltransferase involved in cell wall biosynthesis
VAELVSILIPAYNAEKWISETIKSALEQTWPNKEIIVVDDGSTDHTYSIAREFESSSVKVITQENKGASVARNRALSFAQGDYIQWLDADDLLDLNKISEQMKFASSGLKSLALLSSSFGTFYWRRGKARFAPNELWQDLSPVEWLLNKFNNNFWLVPAVWLVSRRLTEMAGPWDERLSFDDDGEYFCRVVAASESVKFVQTARCYYRKSGFNQLSRKFSEKARKSLLLSLTLCIQQLRSLEESERTRSASLMFLQESLPYFSSENTELLEKINDLAFQLNGQLMTPKLGWKSDLMRRLFGLKRGQEVMATLRKLKFAMAVKWDEILYRLNNS